MAGKFDIVTGSGARERGKGRSLSTIALRTILGAYYVIPDLTQEHFQELLQQLDLQSERVIVRNVSEATLMFPLRILESVNLVEDDISFVSMGELWRNPNPT